jgi:uroporphyrinogen-III synthase
MELEHRLFPREELPLLGKRVLLTTPRNYAGLFAKHLIERGARVVLLPTIEIWPMADYRELDRAIANLGDYDWVIFSSQNGIEAFINRLQALGKGFEDLRGTKLAAFKADASPAESVGFKFSLIPAKSTLDGFIEEFVRMGINQGKALVPMPEFNGIAEPDVIPGFIANLERLGFKVDRVPAYRTSFPTDEASIAIEKGLLINGKIAFVLFTSNAEITNLVAMLGDRWRVLNQTRVACLSNAEAQSATDLGVKVSVVAEKTRPIGLPAAVVEAMEKYLKA